MDQRPDDEFDEPDRPPPPPPSPPRSPPRVRSPPRGPTHADLLRIVDRLPSLDRRSLPPPGAIARDAYRRSAARAAGAREAVTTTQAFNLSAERYVQPQGSQTKFDDEQKALKSLAERPKPLEQIRLG